MLPSDQVIKVLRENRPHLLAHYGAKRIGVFGSYAKGLADEESDIDVVVEFDPPIGFRFVEFAEHLERLLGRKLDVLTPAGIQAIRVPGVAKDIAASVVYV